MYKVIEEGTVTADELVKERITALKVEREPAHAALARSPDANKVPIEFRDVQIVAFGDLTRKQLTTANQWRTRHGTPGDQQL